MSVYFDGDPEFDSQRRHMERVIKGTPRRRKWPWVLAAVAGGGAWAAWRLMKTPAGEKPEDAGDAAVGRTRTSEKK